MTTDINVKESLKDLTSELELRKAYIQRLEETCRDLELKISTLKAAQTILESRTRSAEYIGKSLKEIVITETEKLGTSLDEYINMFDDNPEVKESVARYLTFGIIPPREFRDEICMKAANLFELEFKMLMDSLEVDPAGYNPYGAKTSTTTDEKVNETPSTAFILPKDFGGLVKFYIKKFKITQVDLAKSLGISLPTISVWCTNKGLPRDYHEVIKKLENKFPGSSEDNWIKSVEVTKSILAKNRGAGH